MSSPDSPVPLQGLLLRRERLDDDHLVAAAVEQNLDHLRPWMPWAVPAAATATAQRERLIGAEKCWDEGTDYSFLPLDASEQRLLGIFGLHRRIGPEAIELGYWLDWESTGCGYATAGARALTAAALKLDDVSRVEIHCDEANRRSQLIPQRVGFRLDRIEPDEVEAPAEVGRSMIWVYRLRD